MAGEEVLELQLLGGPPHKQWIFGYNGQARLESDKSLPASLSTCALWFYMNAASQMSVVFQTRQMVHQFLGLCRLCGRWTDKSLLQSLDIQIVLVISFICQVYHAGRQKCSYHKGTSGASVSMNNDLL